MRRNISKTWMPWRDELKISLDCTVILWYARWQSEAISIEPTRGVTWEIKDGWKGTWWAQTSLTPGLSTGMLLDIAKPSREWTAITYWRQNAPSDRKPPRPHSPSITFKRAITSSEIMNGAKRSYLNWTHDRAKRQGRRGKANRRR